MQRQPVQFWDETANSFPFPRPCPRESRHASGLAAAGYPARTADAIWLTLAGIVVGAVLLAATAVRAQDRPSGGRLTDPATDARIVSLIRDLGSPSYEVRTAATRRLCAIGLPARDRLELAAKGDHVEIALRARRLLGVLDRLWFAGVDVSLAFSRPTTAWDEPVDLQITMANHSKRPARVPFEIDTERRTAAASDPLQVGDMIDVADLLLVRGPGGDEVELRVDDIAADPDVVAAVRQRVKAGPIGTIDGGRTITITAHAFNRGWARYPLLDRGEYAVVLHYVPEWEDEILRAGRVGRVISNQASITVTNSAPAAVSRNGVQASLTIERQGGSLVARLTNRSDQPTLINKNFGPAAPFAQGSWLCTLNGSTFNVPVLPERHVGWKDFDEALLVEVAPGRSTELTRIDIAGVQEVLAGAGARPLSDQWTIRFNYSNLCDRQWQLRQGSVLRDNERAPDVLRNPLPRRILSARHASNSLQVPKAE